MRTSVPLTRATAKGMLPYKEKVGELCRALDGFMDWFRDSILNENRDSRRLAPMPNEAWCTQSSDSQLKMCSHPDKPLSAFFNSSSSSRWPN